MNLGAMTARMLPMFREQAESMMTDRATISRPDTSGPVLDDETGDLTPAGTVLVTDYPCRVRSYEPFESTPEVGGQTITVQRTAGRFPVSTAYSPQPGDVVTMTASQHDPSLPDRIFRVASRPQNSISTAYRVYLEEITR